MITRREFLRASSFASALPLVERYSRLVANAQVASTDDYKAIVCLFLFGGNDANNMLVPIDTMSYKVYSSGRGPLAIPQGQLLPLPGISYAVHPSMPEVQSLFANGQLAFIANAGSLVTPLTKDQFSSPEAALPQNLYSHPDQVAIMQTATPQSSIPYGWGGNIVDSISSIYSGSSLPLATSYYGASTFINGQNSTGLIAPSQAGSFPCAEGGACNAMESAAQEILACDDTVLLVQQDQSLMARMYSLNSVYAKAMAQGTPLRTQFASGGLSSELSQVAQMMQVRKVVGAQRQIFFVGLGSFDTHANQLSYHAGMLAQLSSSINVFAQALQELNIFNDVTLFTLSDFNRTLQGNSSMGTDHAWGSHLLAMGGGVKGGKIYGTFPVLELGGPDDVSTVGRWLPTTSISQLGASLASWFGVPDAQLPVVFPSLTNFSNSKLGFI
jgi:uncharacterized protein (DUF1501 family)